MRRFLIAFVLILSLMFVSNVNAGSYFIGLWQGVDPDDGSEVLLSMFENDDGTYSILGHESNFYVCNDTDKGVLTGTGQVENGVLVATEMIQCFAEGGSETIGPYSVNYVPDARNQILIIKYETPDVGPLILYRISK